MLLGSTMDAIYIYVLYIYIYINNGCLDFVPGRAMTAETHKLPNCSRLPLTELYFTENCGFRVLGLGYSAARGIWIMIFVSIER